MPNNIPSEGPWRPEWDRPNPFMDERTYADDRIPVTDEERYPHNGSDQTEYTGGDDLLDEILTLENEEEGIIGENELVLESPVYDTELGMENLENEYADE